MEVWVNQEKLDFSLNEEKNLAEVITGLERWSKTANLVIYKVLVNNEEVINFQNKNETKKIPLKEIKKIAATVLSEVAYTVHVLKEVKDLLSFFNEVTDASFKGFFKKMTEYIDYFKQSFLYSDKILDMENDFKLIHVLLKNLEIEIFKINQGEKKYSASTVKATSKLLQDNLEALFFRFNIKIISANFKKDKMSFQNTLINLVLLLDFLGEYLVISASEFQKNQTGLALNKLYDITSVLELVFYIISELKKRFLEKKSFEEIVDDFNKSADTLKELLTVIKSSLENKDYVEISDILEYEIKEILPELKDNFQKTIELFKKGKVGQALE